MGVKEMAINGGEESAWLVNLVGFRLFKRRACRTFSIGLLSKWIELRNFRIVFFFFFNGV